MRLCWRPLQRCRLRNWWDGASVQALSKELFGAAEGSHATCSEVSLTYYAYPEQVKSAEMTPEIAPSGPIYDADDFRRRHPDGRMGSNPALASVEAGERLYRGALQDSVADYQAFMGGAAGVND